MAFESLALWVAAAVCAGIATDVQAAEELNEAKRQLADYYGGDRKGDNLYANSIVALDRRTGKLRWYYQFTPHDLWDWDATQTSVLIDAAWEGLPRRLMLHASRNGFFYVFDRENGKLLLATPFVRNLTCASGIGADGRPIKLANQEPTPAGTKVCPSQENSGSVSVPSKEQYTLQRHHIGPLRNLLFTKSPKGLGSRKANL